MRFVDQLKAASATGEQEARECKQQASEKRFAEYQARKDAHAQGIVTRVMTNFEENVMSAAKSGRRSMHLYQQHGDNYTSFDMRGHPILEEMHRRIEATGLKIKVYEDESRLGFEKGDSPYLEVYVVWE